MSATTLLSSSFKSDKILFTLGFLGEGADLPALALWRLVEDVFAEDFLAGFPGEAKERMDGCEGVLRRPLPGDFLGDFAPLPSDFLGDFALDVLLPLARHVPDGPG